MRGENQEQDRMFSYRSPTEVIRGSLSCPPGRHHFPGVFFARIACRSLATMVYGHHLENAIFPLFLTTCQRSSNAVTAVATACFKPLGRWLESAGGANKSLSNMELAPRQLQGAFSLWGLWYQTGIRRLGKVKKKYPEPWKRQESPYYQFWWTDHAGNPRKCSSGEVLKEQARKAIRKYVDRLDSPSSQESLTFRAYAEPFFRWDTCPLAKSRRWLAHVRGFADRFRLTDFEKCPFYWVF